MLKKYFEWLRNFLALVGLISLIGGVAGTLFVLKRHDPRELGEKVLKKAGLEHSVLARMLQQDPSRPAGVHFPFQGGADWAGHGAVNKRKLLPVLYFRSQTPVPRQWQTLAGIGPVTVQQYKRIVNVSTVKGFLSALKHAGAGDIILLAPGVYRIKAYNVNISSPGTARWPICVRAGHLGEVTLEMDTFEGFFVNAPFWIFENLDIKGVRKNHDGQEHAFHVVGEGNGFVLRNCRVHEFNAIIKANGTRGKDGKVHYPDNALIEDNTLYNSEVRRTSKPVNALDVVSCNNWIVRGNFISDFAKGEGNRISYAAFIKGNSSGGVFENNLVIGEYRTSGGVRVGLSFGGGGTGKRFLRGGESDTEHRNGIIRNNVVMYFTDVAVYLNKAAGTKIYNNTFYKTMGIDVRFKSSSADIKNNLMTGRIKNRDGGTSIQDNNIIVPASSVLKKDFSDWFVDPMKGDFSLKKQGPFIDSALILPEVYEDFCGRPRSDKPDVGAFEYEAHSGPCRLIGVALNRDIS